MSTSSTTVAVLLESDLNYSVHLVISGAPVGTSTVLGSNNGTTFTTIAGSSGTVNGAGSGMYNIGACGYKYIQVHYAASSGSGSMVVTIEAKGV